MRNLFFAITLMLAARGTADAPNEELNAPFQVRWSPCGSSDYMPACSPQAFIVTQIDTLSRGRVNLIYYGEVIANVDGSPEFSNHNKRWKKQLQINVRRTNDRLKTMMGRLEAKEKERQKVFEGRSISWQESPQGEEYLKKTRLISNAIDGVNDAIFFQ